MGFLQSKEAQRGYQRQDELIPLIEVVLIREGYDCMVKSGTKNEDMKEHIDAKIYMNDYETFRGYHVTPIDIKTGKTFTIKSDTGLDNLKGTKSAYLVYEKNENDNYLIFIQVKKLRELVQKHSPKIFNSYYDNSKFFYILDFMDDHFNECDPDEYFIYKK